MWRAGVLALAVLLDLGAASAEAIRLSHQGLERSALVHRPAQAPGGPLSVVIALHGLGDTAENFRRWFGLDATADREGFAVVYPEAVEKAWSYGHPIARAVPTIDGEPVDDVGFLRRLMERLVADKIAEPSRIYVTGMSRGGLMTFTVACALADHVAGAAALITGMTEPQRAECRPQRPVPILVLAGTNDALQPYDGWLYDKGRLLSVPETMEFWRALHGCTAQSASPLPHRDMSDRTRVQRIEWSGCASGARLVLLRVHNGGHQLPSIARPASDSSVQRHGLRNRDIETADEVWGFLKAYRR